MGKKNLAAATAGLMILTICGRVTGLLREMVLSYIYGASAMSDAYIVGTSFSTVVFAGIAAAFLSAYIPLASSERDQERLSLFTSNLANTSLLFTCSIGIVLAALIKPLISIVAVGFSGETFRNTVVIGVFSLLSSAFLCFGNLMVGYLQIKNRFAASGFQSILSNIIVVISLFVTAHNAFALGAGFAVSLVAPAILLLLYAIKNGFSYIPKINLSDQTLRVAIKLAMPIFVGQVAIQFNSFVDRSFASTLPEGTVSALKYGSLLCTFAVSIFSVSVGTVIYPQVSRLSEEKQWTEMAETISGSIRNVIFMVTPLIVGGVLLATPIVRLLFERGAFSTTDTLITSSVFQIYAFGILGNSLSEILNRAFFAQKDSLTPITRYGMGVGLNVVLNVILIRFFGAQGLAFSTSFCSTVIMAALLLSFKQKVKEFYLGTVVKGFFQSLLAGLVMAVIVTISMTLMSQLMYDDRIIMKLLVLGVPATLGIASYVISLYVMKIPELRHFLKLLKKG